MKAKAVVAALLAGALCCASCAPARPTVSSPADAPPGASPPGTTPPGTRPPATARETPPTKAPVVDFGAQIRPILEARCRPCHFEGGKMYARLPFDRPGTIRDLGTRLFTRIKDEQEQALIRLFLTQPGSAEDGNVCREPPAVDSAS